MKKKAYLIIAVVLMICYGVIAQQPNIHTQIPGLSKWFITEINPDESIVLRDILSSFKTPFSSVSAPFLLNFNPTVSFDDFSNGFSTLLKGENLQDLTVLVVAYSADSSCERSILSFEKNFKPQIILTTNRAANLVKYQYMNFAGIANQPRIMSYYSSTQDKKSENIYQVLRIGGKPESDLPITSFKGQVAEILLYDRVLSGIEVRQVETFLALKYGIGMVGDYLGSNGQIIWDAKKYKTFSQTVIGFGRDDSFRLYQKQSKSSLTSKPLLILGLDSVQLSNDANKSVLQNHSFLICGSNSGLPFFDDQLNDSIRMLAKKWLVASSGPNIDLGTELRFAPGQLAERPKSGEHYVLLIDRTGTGEFLASNIKAIEPSSEIGENGDIIFRNVQWDTDRSGSDVFTLAVRNSNSPEVGPIEEYDLFESVELWPNPSEGGDFQIAIKLRKEADITVKVTDQCGRLIFTNAGKSSDRYFFSGQVLHKGDYFVSVTSSDSARILQFFVP